MTPKAKIKSNFTVVTLVEENYTSTYDVLEDFLDAYIPGDFHSEEELKYAFNEFVSNNYDLIPDLIFGQEFNELDSIEILNWDEVYLALAHLIDEDKRKQCCKTYSKVEGYLYCPICGTKY